MSVSDAIARDFDRENGKVDYVSVVAKKTCTEHLDRIESGIADLDNSYFWTVQMHSILCHFIRTSATAALISEREA